MRGGGSAPGKYREGDDDGMATHQTRRQSLMTLPQPTASGGAERAKSTLCTLCLAEGATSARSGRVAFHLHRSQAVSKGNERERWRTMRTHRVGTSKDPGDCRARNGQRTDEKCQPGLTAATRTADRRSSLTCFAGVGSSVSPVASPCVVAAAAAGWAESPEGSGIVESASFSRARASRILWK